MFSKTIYYGVLGYCLIETNFLRMFNICLLQGLPL